MEQLLIQAAKLLLYLRKSRSDDPSESVSEVLAKHETQLQEFAEREFGARIPEENIYREVISAESIDAREEFKKVLARVEDPSVVGVLAMDPQRLSRGDLGDCDRLIKSLHLSGTLVVTPMMTYDLGKKMERKFFQDELLRGRDYYEYTRDILFMGRIRSVKRGNYIAQYAPYGYEKVKIGKDHTLDIVPQEAEIVRLIFAWYTEEGLTPFFIAKRLNEMGVKAPRGEYWEKCTIRVILCNRHYVGKVVFNQKKNTQVLENGEVITKRLSQPEEDVVVAEGKHPAIIDKETWEKAQSRFAQNPRLNNGKVLRNPLSGILRCGKCGRAMYVHTYKKAADRYECRTKPRCYKSVNQEEVLEAVLYALETVELPKLQERVVNDDGDARKIQQKLLEKLEKQMQEYRDQEEKQFDLLETGVYSQERFDQRNAALREKMETCQQSIYKAKATLPESVDFAERVVTLEKAIAALRNDDLTPAEKNKIVKAIVERVNLYGVESVDHRGRKGVKQNGSHFTLEVFLRL